MRLGLKSAVRGLCKNQPRICAGNWMLYTLACSSKLCTFKLSAWTARTFVAAAAPSLLHTAANSRSTSRNLQPTYYRAGLMAACTRSIHPSASLALLSTAPASTARSTLTRRPDVAVARMLLTHPPIAHHTIASRPTLADGHRHQQPSLGGLCCASVFEQDGPSQHVTTLLYCMPKAI
jgi:hypothetical protein